MRTPGLVVCTLASWCAALVLASPSPAADAKAPPNVVLIISDDHGWTDYSFMGHPQIRTPNLDRLAAQSLVYRRGYVPSSLCCPSLASIITGLYPHQHKITGNDPPEPANSKRGDPAWTKAFREGRAVMTRYMEEAPTLPRLLGQKGYLSLQTGKWWQGNYKSGGFTHGMSRGDRHGDDGLAIGRQTLAPVTEFIATARKENKPFFVWYAPMLPHTPHNPPERLLAHYKDKAPSLPVARYWAMVEWFDETCGRLLDHLDKEGLAENTIVAYVADNGWVQAPDKAGSVRSKQSPYDAGLRTPIMIRWPGHVQPRTSDELAMSIDLAPTLLTAVGLKLASGQQGVNLLDERAVSQRKAVQGECFVHTTVDLNHPAKNLRWRWRVEGRWKLIVPADPNEKAELYDVIADPQETTDRAGQKPEVVKELRQKLDAWWNPA